MKFQKMSILTEHLNAIYQCPNVEEAKQMFLDIVNQSRINEQSKRIMRIKIAQCVTLIDVQRYATNSCFQYNGMKVRNANAF